MFGLSPSPGEKRLQGLLVVPIVQDDGSTLGVLDVGEQRRNGRSTLDHRSLELAKNLAKEIAAVVAIARAPSEDIGSIPSAAVNQAGVICDLLRSNELHRGSNKRASVWLYHVGGMSHEEVGRVLGLSRRTIINYLNDFHERAAVFVRRQL